MSTYTYTPSKKNSTLKTRYFVLVAALLFTGAQALAQEASAGKTISGVVRFSEDNEPAPGVNIYLKGSTAEGTYTDKNGAFEFPRPVKVGDVVVFSFIGRTTEEYVVTNETSSPLDIVLGPDFIELVQAPLMEGEERRSRIARLFRRSH